MKIFLFNLETGYYLGEDFADATALAAGTFEIPADATTIAPPPAQTGQVPVFDPLLQRWELRPSV